MKGFFLQRKFHDPKDPKVYRGHVSRGVFNNLEIYVGWSIDAAEWLGRCLNEVELDPGSCLVAFVITL